jgi:hypothetical protein
MMRIVYLLCEAGTGGQCTENVLAFAPPIPVACIHAAGPELARVTPEGWRVRRWSCADTDPDRAIARNDPED